MAAYYRRQEFEDHGRASRPIPTRSYNVTDEVREVKVSTSD